MSISCIDIQYLCSPTKEKLVKWRLVFPISCQITDLAQNESSGAGAQLTVQDFANTPSLYFNTLYFCWLQNKMEPYQMES